MRTRVLLAGLLALMLLVSCATTEGGEVSKKTECNILFIGNSFTYGNNLPWLFSNICESYGYKKVTADSVMVGSYTLEMFCDPENKYCKQIDEKLANNSYDIVIIQDAYVDAELSSFDISEDLSLQLQPTIITTDPRAHGSASDFARGGANIGFSFAVNF